MGPALARLRFTAGPAARLQLGVVRLPVLRLLAFRFLQIDGHSF